MSFPKIYRLSLSGKSLARLPISSSLIVTFLFLSISVSAQRPDPFPSDTSQTNLVIIDTASVMRFVEGRRELAGNVILILDDAILYCDSAAIEDNNARAYGNIVIEQEDSVFVYSDKMYYFGEERKAELYGEVVLTDSVQTLRTDRLDYDLNTRIGSYKTGATLESGGTTLTSKRGYYHANTREAYFKEDVVVVDSNYTLNSDSLNFSTETQVTTFVAPTYIVTNENQIYCEAGFYDTKRNYAEFERNARLVNDEQAVTADKIKYDGNKDESEFLGQVSGVDAGRTYEADDMFYEAAEDVMHFIGNVMIKDSSQIIYADKIDYYGKSNLGIAVGNVTMINEEDDITIQCEVGEYNDQSESMKAYGRPFLTTLLGSDTLWLSADTLYSYTIFDSLKHNLIVANNDVRMFKEDVQSVCDSLAYNTLDSVFRFYGAPILWSDTTQFTADSMYVYTEKQGIDRVDMIENAFIVNTEDSVYFNQIKGRNIVAHFEDEQVRNMEVLGNGESVYYVLDDDDAYIGVNKTICSEMLIFFGDNEVDKINFYTQPKATIYPMGQVNHSSLRMPGFSWMVDQRPSSQYDLRY